MTEEYCNNCDKETETDYKYEHLNYVAHYCMECGADKKNDPKAPV